MASFKEHAAFGFWKGSLIVGDRSKNAEAMGQLGRLTTLSDLPPKGVLATYIKKAVALSQKAQAAFAAFSPSHKREYIEWITEAKSSDTRARRLQTALEWMAEGKPRNWKYMRR
jgi:uncharacterized protein YdeI (YjbR/CyaY-like superfamily)